MTEKPELTLRDGAIKAAIWRNSGTGGDFFTTSISRTYRDEKSGEFKDTNSFTGSDLLKVSALAQEAYQQTRALLHDQQADRVRDERSEKTLEEDRSRTRRRSRTREHGRER
ncbi:hypothetical protein PB2503_05787 [Parvularcula bermudensis HTCC2503]|uniref:Uncharacterized protein n=1 Tax=Parvularcula bermudensis (strain ATCC BAA-594 / HTCC2503 / KCTC 12087) TaxID=314260 RepID=E0TGY8_PARBH|nr:hypothetical protein [Parvularcula bermudensis]ADM09228.1 hypothetical protein PB2503_05787 [Parvularcula bermudensis HTCC2503]